MSPDFALETTEHDGEYRVALRGECDLAAEENLDAALDDVQSRGPVRVVIDLRGLRFIDSSGLRVILRAKARSAQTGGTLELIRGPEPVHRVFELTRLDRELTFLDLED
jgi:anti-sigma B factor antagonist